MNMKGQYFSFDAIIATVIMVLAFSSLIAYWQGAQSVIGERASNRLADANRIAESLLSPGSPSDWENGYSISDVRQIGIAKSFGNELDAGKVYALANLASDATGDYEATGNLLRAGGNYYILIEQADDSHGVLREIGKYPDNATYVVVANRGAVLDGRPVRMRVFLWK